MDIDRVMKSLEKKRPIFHLESDFQFALAWEIKSLYEHYDIRLEVPFEFDKRGRIDILVRENGAVYPIELKYLKKALQHTVDGEQFVLADGVHDMEMYDCLADVSRMESYCDNLEGFHTGYVIWLTNDRAYWEYSYNASYYSDFHAPDNSVKTGKMCYAPVNQRTGKPPQILSERKYCSPVVLSGSYKVKWNLYSDLGIPKGQFRYVAICINR